MRAIHHAGYDGFCRSERPWRELTATVRSPRFFHAYDWYAAFFAHLRPADEPIGVLELQRDERCVGLFPYHRRWIRTHGVDIQVLSLPASPHLILADAVLADVLDASECLHALRSCLAHDRVDWHALLLTHVREDSHALRFARALGSRALVRPAGGSRHFDTTQTYEQLSRRFAGSLRKNLRKGTKRLEQAGAVEFLCVGSGDARLPWAFERFLALEASGWKGEAGTRSAIALSAGVAPFYRDLTRAQCPEMRIEINLLCLDGEPIAAQLATVCAAHCSIHKIAYDESFQHASPGSVLMGHTLERSCRDAAVHSLSLVTDMPWMQDWSACRAAVYDVWIPRNAAFAVLARAAVGTKQWLSPRRRAPQQPAPQARDDAPGSE